MNGVVYLSDFVVSCWWYVEYVIIRCFVDVARVQQCHMCMEKIILYLTYIEPGGQLKRGVYTYCTAK